MPEQLVVEIGDDGKFGKLPDQLQRYLDNIVAHERRQIETKANEKAEARYSPYMTDPQELERLRQRDRALGEIELKEAERVKDYEKARTVQEEAHKKALDEAVKAERRNTSRAVDRVREGIRKSVRAVASAQGARPESLDDIERLLAADIDLDDELNEFVRDAADPKKPRLTDKGEPVTVEGFVSDYLKSRPHLIAAAQVKGGKAPGGVTLAGRPTVPGDARSEARAKVAENPTDRNIGALLTTSLRAPAA